VAAARGDHQRAVQQYELAREAGVAIGVSSPSMLADWRTWCAVSLRALDRTNDAMSVAREALEIADRWGAAGAIARALRAYGVAAGGEEGLNHLRRALATVDATELELDKVRIAADLGGALRRAGLTVEARAQLHRAADLARRIGARGIEAQAEEELSAAGSRTVRRSLTGAAALTPSEMRVARLAAGGRTNREIAQSLFVTPKAIEYHLANAYRKLGIAGRAELRQALAGDEAEAVASV
jgi:DNA-binding CsgD family transcriptional regulator